MQLPPDPTAAWRSALTSTAHWAILGYLVTMPWATIFVPQGNGHDLSRLAQVGLFTLCSLAALAAWVVQPPRWSRKGVMLTAALALMAAVSIARAAEPVWALRELALWGGMLATAWVLAQAAQPHALARVAWAVLIGTCLYQGLELLLVVAGQFNGLVPSPQRMGLGYLNYRHYSHVQTIALPLVLWAPLLLPQVPLARRLMWISLATGFALAIFEGGRATALALLAASLAALLLNRRLGAPMFGRLCIGVAAGAAVYAAVFIGLPQALGLPAGESPAQRLQAVAGDDARLYLWRLALDAIGGQPWFGVGPMHLAHLPNLKAAHPHNVYLQLAAEWGLPFALAVLACAGAWMARVAKLLRPPAERAAAEPLGWLWVAGVALAVDAMLSGNLVMPVPQVWAAAAVGLLWQQASRARLASGGAEAAQPARLAPPATTAPFGGWHLRALLAGVLAAGLLTLQAGVLQQSQELGTWLRHSASLAPGAKLVPRFWSVGWF